MFKITITDYGTQTREETLRLALDSRYVICYNEVAKSIILCKNKEDLFLQLSKDYEDLHSVLELYDPSIENNSISFLTKIFKENN